MKTDLQLLKNTQRFRKTKKGVLTNIYHKQKSRKNVDYTLSWFHLKFLNDKKFDRIFWEWIKHKCDKQFKPTIDRINCKKHYTKKNIHCLTWAENRFKQAMERRSRKGAVAQILGNDIVKIYKSQREVVIKTGLSQGNLSEALNGKRQFCGGYKWRYCSNPELLEEKG